MKTLQLSGLLTCVLFGASGNAAVVGDHPSPLTVTEVIANLGGGQYQYTYSFVNTDTSPIWNFFVVADFPVTVSAPFAGHTGWYGGSITVNNVWGVYEPRNLDPNAVQLAHTYTWPLVDEPSAIQVGESVAGFSFIAAQYDPYPRYYFYETIASGYTPSNGTGHVAAVGMTPEPAMLSLLTLGGLLLARRRT